MALFIFQEKAPHQKLYILGISPCRSRLKHSQFLYPVQAKCIHISWPGHVACHCVCPCVIPSTWNTLLILSSFPLVLVGSSKKQMLRWNWKCKRCIRSNTRERKRTKKDKKAELGRELSIHYAGLTKVSISPVKTPEQSQLLEVCRNQKSLGLCTTMLLSHCLSKSLTSVPMQRWILEVPTAGSCQQAGQVVLFGRAI